MPKKSRPLDWFEPIRLLAQDLASKNKKIAEYAGLDEHSALIIAKINALIDIIPDLYPHLKAIIPLLEMKKKIVMEVGHAKWVSNASEITNLGLLVPKKTATLDLKQETGKNNDGENIEEPELG